MIKRPPLSDSFTLVYAADPALDSERETFAHDYESAKERQDWTGLTKDGAEPTVFRFAPLPGSILRALFSYIERRGESMEKISVETMATIFRMTLTGASPLPESFPSLTRRIDSDRPELGPMVGSAVVDYLDSIDASIVSSLSLTAFLMSISPPPKR